MGTYYKQEEHAQRKGGKLNRMAVRERLTLNQPKVVPECFAIKRSLDELNKRYRNVSFWKYSNVVHNDKNSFFFFFFFLFILLKYLCKYS